MRELFEKLLELFDFVKDGTIGKVITDNATMYKVGNIIRIDIKLK